MLVGQGAGYLFQAVYFVLLARLLGITEYGIFVGAFAFTSLISQYSSLGSGTVFLRYVTGNVKEFAPYWGNILLSTISTGAALAVILPLLAPHILNPASARLVFLAALANCLCSTLTVEIGRIFQSYEKLRITAMLNLLTNAARTLTVAVLLFGWHHASAWQWTVASTIVTGLASVAAVTAVLVNFGRPAFRAGLFKRHALEGVGFSFAASTAAVYNDLDKTMLSHYGMNFANGIYAMAYRVIDFATMPIFATRDAALPRLFRLGREGLPHAAVLATSLLRKLLVLTLAIAAILFLMAPLIPYVVGKGFVESIVALRWLALIPLFRSIHQMAGCALTGAGFQKYRTASQLSAAAFNFGLNLWLIPRYSWRGAAWSSLATDGGLAIMNWAILQFLLARARRHGSQQPPPMTPTLLNEEAA